MSHDPRVPRMCCIPSSPALAHHTKILPATDDDGGAERCKRDGGHLHGIRHGARWGSGQVLVDVVKPAVLRGGRRGCGRVVGGGLLLGERGFGHGWTEGSGGAKVSEGRRRRKRICQCPVSRNSCCMNTARGGILTAGCYWYGCVGGSAMEGQWLQGGILGEFTAGMASSVEKHPLHRPPSQMPRQLTTHWPSANALRPRWRHDSLLIIILPPLCPVFLWRVLVALGDADNAYMNGATFRLASPHVMRSESACVAELLPKSWGLHPPHPPPCLTLTLMLLLALLSLIAQKQWPRRWGFIW